MSAPRDPRDEGFRAITALLWAAGVPIAVALGAWAILTAIARGWLS